MIVQEVITVNTDEFIRTFSSDNKYIRKVNTDEIYSEAVDLVDSNYQYEETDIPIET